MPPKESRNADHLTDLRLKSRQSYLAKRESQQLHLLRQQVADEQAEEASNPRLSARERAEFARNRETLRLAEERLAIDEHRDGFFIPDADYDDKREALNRKQRDNEYVSEVAQWENEQTAKAKAQIKKTERVAEGDYEFVFDESQGIKFAAAATHNPDKAHLQKLLDTAEQKARSIEDVRKSLPMFQWKDKIIAAVTQHQVLVLVGETGSGKTTQVPQYLEEAGFCKGGLVVGCTQPRRVAAMSVAKRVSEEFGCKLGQEVGYSVRFDQKQTEGKTILKFLTDGMLLKEMMTDPSLEHYGTIIVDEAHERSTSTDILLPLIKDIAKYRPEFRVIISSATMDAQKWSKYFNDCPIFSVPGRAFPIEIYHTESPEANYLSAAVTTVFQIHLTQPLGDILVFLTGEDEIVSVQENLEETCRKLQGRCPEMIICPLYAALPSDLQSKVFEPTPPRARKVVLATNIAETSLTIDNIIYVVDSGFVKENVYSPQTGIESLVVTPCSQASANQRAGRAGRTNPGKAFRLYTRYSYYNELPASPTPELLRCDLTPIVLLLKGLGLNDLVNFDFLDGPPADTLIRSLETLYALGAIDDKGAITRTGRKMAEIPLAPSAGAAMLASDRYKCSEEVLSIVAMLQESQALFFRPKDKKLHADAAHRRFCDREGGDHLTLLRIWREWCDSDFSPIWAKENFLQQRTLTRVRDVRDQLQTLADRVEIEHSSAGDDAIAIKKAMTTGYFPNAARLNRSGDSYRCLKNGMTVFIHPSSVIQEDKPKWVLYDSLTTTSKEYMRNILPIDSQWLLDAAPHMYKPEDLEKLGVDKKMPKARKPQ